MALRVGIDFGTTNTLVSWSDRGNYPILPLEETESLAMPSVVAWRGDEIRVGSEALAAWQEPGWVVLPSLKRWLGVPDPDLGAELPSRAADFIETLLTALFAAARERVLRAVQETEEVEAIVGVPANANSLQRLRTFRAAQRAGFVVRGLMHEPTASAVEYAHLHRGFARLKERRHIAVYDLGGGTFDAAIVSASPAGFDVVRSGGVERLGGDDFDAAMAALVLEKLSLSEEALEWQERLRLLRICRDAKESLRPTTKKLVIDLDEIGRGEAAVYTDDYYARCLPLVDRTVEALERVLVTSGLGLTDVDALLLVGGASQMPLVRRRLKELFASRVKVSPHPYASTAVGLAIQASRTNTTTVAERFARHFGVWREKEGGARPAFDPIFDKETRLPPVGERIVIHRAYRPVHGIGRFRFEECSDVDAEGNPLTDRTPWCEVYFPFDPALPLGQPLDHFPVERSDRFLGLEVEEQYEVDSDGIITVRIVRRDPPLSLAYLLYGPERVAPLG